MSLQFPSDRSLHPDPAFARRLEATQFVRLMRQTIVSARLGTEAALANRQEMAQLPTLVAAVAHAIADASRIQSDVIDETTNALRVADASGDRALQYRNILQAHDHWRASWRHLVPGGQVPAILDELLMWQTAWHLLAAEVPLPRILGSFRFVKPIAEARPTNHWSHVQSTVTHAAGAIATVSGNLVRAGFEIADGIRESRAAAERQRREQIAAKRAAAVARAEAAAAAALRGSKTPHARSSEPIAINGRALHRSVFGT